LGIIDPVELNLEVARGIAEFDNINVPTYLTIVDGWAGEFRRLLPNAERQFWQTPGDWKEDVRFFRLGMLCWYLGEVLGIRYKESQVDSVAVRYTDPGDLFLNGLIDTRRGTCGNLPVLYMALARRLAWDVSLMIAGSHVLCRYADGPVCYNIECTNFAGGFRSPPDEHLQETDGIPSEAITAGSDLCSLTPRQTLGWYIGLRARHHADCGRLSEAEADYGLAVSLFPESRRLRFSLAESSYLISDRTPCDASLNWNMTSGTSRL
jgi:hypothetical protein